MDLITFRCTSCNQGLKIPADKAGRKVKCTKCGTPLVVPAASQAGPAVAPKPAPAKKKPVDDDEEDGGGVYTFQAGEEPATAEAAPPPPRRRDEDEEDEDQEEFDEEDEEEQREKDEELRRRLLGLDEEEDEEEDEEDQDEAAARPKKSRRRGKAKLNPTVWQRVRVGLILALVSVGLLALAVLLHEIVVIIGLAAGPQYNKVVATVHPHFSGGELNKARLFIGMISGLGGLDASVTLVRIAQVLMVLQGLVMIAACALCLGVPSRFAAKAMDVTTLSLAAVNLIVGVVFKLLPLVGAISFFLIPLIVPELPMISANEERFLPLPLLWGGAPYAQVLVTVFILALQFLEYVLFPLFLKALAQNLKNEPLEENAVSLVQLGLAQVFIQITFQLLAMTGASDVLGWVLRVVYCIGLGFYILQLVWYVLLLLKTRRIIQETLDEEAAWE